MFRGTTSTIGVCASPPKRRRMFLPRGKEFDVFRLVIFDENYYWDLRRRVGTKRESGRSSESSPRADMEMGVRDKTSNISRTRGNLPVFLRRRKRRRNFDGVDTPWVVVG